MSAKTGTPLPAHWDYYIRCSREADNGRADDLGKGRDEQLWETLLTIERGDQFNDATIARLNRIPWNRAAKHRRLRESLATERPAVCVGDGPQVDALITKDSVAVLRKCLSADDWDVESRLAAGETLMQVAGRYTVSPGALKVRVMRWRDKIRACRGAE